MRPQEFKDLLDKYAHGECTAEEEQLILDWYDQIAKSEEKEIKEEYRILVQAKIWSKLQKETRQDSGGHTMLWQKIAASIALILMAGAGAFAIYTFTNQEALQTANLNSTEVYSSEFIVITNSQSEPKTINLSDGSEVTLQGNSEVRYPSTFGATREVYLKGEAFFQVKRDPEHPFLVYTHEVVTRVLGTSFTIRAYDKSENITVSVKSGRVSVYKMNEERKVQSDEVILAPNQQAVYDRALDRVSKELVSKPLIIRPNPKRLTMEYEGAQVVSVLEDLQELYGVDISYNEEILSGCTITTSLQEEGLFERVKVICEAIGAHYEIQGTAILISSEGCHE